MATKQQQMAWGIELGVHSRIPPCCIAFFLVQWLPKFDTLFVRRHRRWFRRVAKKHRLDWQYVPCPVCVEAKKVVKIHLCTRRCAPRYRQACLGEK